ncbi:MAG: hypothetical protein QE263_08390 [Vampirovibrionales bacterium]|nr:hypothetical protein [Vampirovibrionales bacterium]
MITALLLPSLGGWAERVASVSDLETRWLQQTYDAEPVEARLQRLETTVLGESHDDQPLEERLQALQQLFVRYYASQSNNSAPLSTSQQASTNSQSQPAIDDSTTALAPTSPPLLGALEQVLLNRRFDDQPDGDRLNRLEWKTFLTTFPSQPLDERLDRLVRRYPQAIEYARSFVTYQQSQSQQSPSSPMTPVYTPPQVRPPLRP